ncbi:MAG TPA: S41 family peptidase [Chitinophaga sp.]|uniref:S41 family peptidase n=1 Tax=Chitinophaga sp. TaxID=1869181 RepID=UPI002C581E19|nr:S41 family peptidase [Chitinophaga sp.]HVI44425.1 S41 family peptidase [Chitinophaga sp.]
MRYPAILFFLSAIIFASSCSKKDDTPPTPTGPVTQQEINNWVMDSMRIFYLWNNQLPNRPDNSLETRTFFNTIKSGEDKFSMIYNPNDPSTIENDVLYKFGLDFSIVNWTSAPGSSVIGVVKVVAPNSPAANAGFKRGNYFTRINGTVLTSANAVQLSEQLKKAASGSITKAIVNSGTVTEDTTITLQEGYVSENPLYMTNVFQQGAKKAGYIFYNAFTDRYNNYVLTAFQEFKSKNVTDLIIDMRYNVGGSLAAAAMMTILTAPNINAQSPFVKYTDNRGSSRIIDFSTALAYPESGGPINFNNLSSGRLMLPRVYIISGRQTISAAEVLINNLKPYAQVVQIGQTTAGKDKGAIIIKDMRTPQRIPWILLPLTYRLSNANGDGNYTQGISPQYTIDEMSAQPLQEIGSSQDPLIAKALALISGNGRAIPETNTTTNTIYDSRMGIANTSVVILPRTDMIK